MNIASVKIENGYIYIEDDKGYRVGNPIKWFKRLSGATKEQLNNFKLSPFGIHWEELDEDLSFEGIVRQINPSETFEYAKN